MVLHGLAALSNRHVWVEVYTLPYEGKKMSRSRVAAVASREK